MDNATAPAKRPRLNPHGKAVRRKRIFERLRGGWSYEAIAREEQVTTRRIRQIVAEALRRREVDGGSDHALLQLARLESALRLGAETLEAGDMRAIGPYLAVLDRIDRYRRGAAPLQVYDEAARERLFAKLNRVANRLITGSEPKPPAAEGGNPSAGEAAKPEGQAAVGP
jgi:hypothetical protein